MDALPLSFKDHFTQVIGDMASAVCQRPGETHEKQVLRSKIAIQTVLGLRPRDSIEALVAGHCMMYHELIVDAVHTSLRDDMQVSTPQVDRLAAIAQETPGVFGARMMGGGFGGCVIALVESSGAGSASEAIQNAYGAVIGKRPDAFVCRAVAGAGEIFA